MSIPNDSRQVSLGPSVPRIDITPLDLPAEPPRQVVCIVCGGTRTRTVDPNAEPWDCHVCGGSGAIGGQA